MPENDGQTAEGRSNDDPDHNLPKGFSCFFGLAGGIKDDRQREAKQYDDNEGAKQASAYSE